MSSTTTPRAVPTDSAAGQKGPPLRVLGLHGSEGTAERFSLEVLQSWLQTTKTTTSSHEQEWEIVTLNGTQTKGAGYSWWSMPPRVRSFNATVYEGFKESAELVLSTLCGNEDDACAFDLVVAHSQGAILATALLALGRIPQHPRVGYILNGVAWPNPYTEQLEALRVDTNVDAPPPRILMICGQRDAMNPPEQAQRVQAALEQAGMDVTVLHHSGGHGVPVLSSNNNKGNDKQDGDDDDDDKQETVQAILDWIQEGRINKD